MTADRTLPELDYAGDPLGALRVTELRLCNSSLSRTLGKSVDVVDAISTPTEHRWDAMAYVGWVLAKRTEPTCPLGIWTAATAAELSAALPVRPEPETSPPDQEEGETPPPSLDDLEAEAKRDPTEPTA
jgi:hypothetical protein